MKVYPFRAIYPKAELLASVDSFLDNVKYKFPEFVQSGYYQKMEKEGFYICRISTNGQDHIGLITSTDISDITEGNIIKHENTLASKEQDTMNYILQRQAMIKPILLTHKVVPALEKLYKKVIASEKPFYVADAEIRGTTTSYYAVNDKRTIAEIQKLLKSKIPSCYIADGHHRCSTATILHKNKTEKKSIFTFAKVLTAYFSFQELTIFDYNRVVILPPEVSSTKLMVSLSQYCKIVAIEGPKKPSKKHEMTMLIQDEWYKLNWKNTAIQEYEADVKLDVDLFNHYILEKLIGIEDVRSDKSVKYISGTVTLEHMLNKVSKAKHAFAMNLFPVKMNEFVKISDQGKTLPPKSTWFEPRLNNGLLVQSLLKS